MNFSSVKSLKLIQALTLALFLQFSFATFATSQENQKTLSQLCTVQSREINENSGIALSNRYENAIWTHNDSGSPAMVYLFSQTSGKTLAKFEVLGAANRDWEDISSVSHGGKNYLIVGDTGDNSKRRDNYQLCIFPEPEFDLTDHDDPKVYVGEIESWKNLQFEYADGASHDCEALTADLANNQIILFEKVYVRDDRVPGVWIIKLPEEKTDEPILAERVADIKVKNITAMDISPDGNQLVARTYVDGFLFSKTDEQDWADVLRDLESNPPKRLALPMQRQGEGVAFNRDGTSIILSSEFRLAPLWQLELRSEETND